MIHIYRNKMTEFALHLDWDSLSTSKLCIKIENEIKRLFCLTNDIGQQKDEQEKEVVELKAKNDEILDLFHNVSFFFSKTFFDRENFREILEFCLWWIFFNQFWKSLLSCLVLSVVRPLTPEAGVFPCYIPIAGISESYLRNPSLGAMHTTSFDFFRCVIH